MSPRARIYRAVACIPRGRVSTYGAIAIATGTHPRTVGQALHKNPDPSKIPCHRVLNAKGYISDSFAFGGAQGQEKLLNQEGVTVVKKRVDLSRYSIRIKT
jgi:O-6-methylguanine DNA methyltransferase